MLVDVVNEIFCLCGSCFPVENEATLKYLASVYAKNHPKMHHGDAGCSNNGQSMPFEYC